MAMNGADSGSDCEVIEKLPPDQEFFAKKTESELADLERHRVDFDELEERLYKCTVCQKQVNHKQRGHLVRHPTLGVPVCKRCKKFYYAGKWIKDEEGKFEYCGWCAQGGENLFICDTETCPNAFCSKCIKRNLGRNEVTKIEDADRWFCYECKPKPLIQLQSLYYSFVKFWEADEAKAKRKAEAQQEEASSRKSFSTNDSSVVKVKLPFLNKKPKKPKSSDAITKTLSDADVSLSLVKTLLDKERDDWTKSKNDSKENTIEFAKRLAKIIAVTERNWDRLRTLLVEHLNDELGPDTKRDRAILKLSKDSDIEGDFTFDDDSRTHEDSSLEIEENVPEDKCKQDKESKHKDKKADDSDDSDFSLELNLPKSPEPTKAKTSTTEKKSSSGEKSGKTKKNGKGAKDSDESESDSDSDPETEPKQELDEIEKDKIKFKVLQSSSDEEVENEAEQPEPAPEADVDHVSESDCDENESESGTELPTKVNKEDSRESSPIKATVQVKTEPSLSSPVRSSKNNKRKVRSSSDEEDREEKVKKEYLGDGEKPIAVNGFVKKTVSPNTKAKEEVLATSSDDDDEENSIVSPKKKKLKAKASKVQAAILNISSDDEVDHKEVCPNRFVRRLKHRFASHIAEIDIKSDPKLNGNIKLKLELRPLDLKYLKAIEESGDNTLDLSEHPELQVQSQKTSKKITSARSEAAKFDSEINRLCDLGALDKMAKQTSSSSNGTSRPSRKAKQDKAAIVDDDFSDDLHDNGDSDFSANESIDEEVRTSKSKSKADRAKEEALATSDSDVIAEEDEEQPLKVKKKKAEKNGDSNSKDKKASSKAKGNDPAFMRVKLDESDTDEEEEKALKRREKRKQKDAENESDSETKDKSPRKSRNKKKKKPAIDDSSGDEFKADGDSNSDEDSDDDMKDDDDISDEEESKKKDDDSDSDVEVGKKKKVAKKGQKRGRGGKKKKKKKSSSSSSGTSSDEEARPKKKRKRIKKNKDSSDDEAGSGKGSGSGSGSGEDDSPTKGRKHIRKIIKDKKLTKETKVAADEERERRKRVEERQKVYNELYKIKDDAVVEKCVLDLDSESKEILVEVHKDICKNLKPHQARGIKFMWEAVFETKKDVENDRVPGGAILAHCMGLGKTLQTIGLVHTVMTHLPEKLKMVLVLAPVNTLKNWEDEFYKWLTGELEDDIIVHEISGEKDNWGRMERLRYWQREGGCMIMGYDMFRNLTNETSKKFKKKQKEVFWSALVDPGPQLVICDEGHVLKNTKSALNIAMTKIKTRRRVILTGTPLQNNLSEYYAMVNFVKPQLLGTYHEFKNRFVNPIQNGQHSDSTERDVRIMKKRSFILSDLLKGCLQRLDYNVLVPFLQPKFEYVLCINLTDFQKKLYCYYLENFARAGQIGADGKLEGGKKGGLFYDVQNLSRVWNHPYILLRAKEQSDMRKLMQDDAEADLEFINDDSGEESEAKSTSSDDDLKSGGEEEPEVMKRKIATRGRREEDDELLDGGLDEQRAKDLAETRGWWTKFMQDPDSVEELMQVELGAKMVLLMEILKECYLIGDKVLVFSQSLLSLDLIESFLEKTSREQELSGTLGTWKPGKDYFRMDGSTPPDTRKKWCSYFNNKNHTDCRLFLISTKAGGLGINLVAANRVIIFDASWNPAHDVQSIFRVYRFGQEKPVYIYRFLAKGTMEEKIYDRQVTKQSLSARVVDEQQIERHFTMNELAELYEFKDEPKESQPPVKLPQDKLLAELILKYKDMIWKIHDHDSLLEHQQDENLTEEERKAAWEEYENEKKGIVNMAASALNSNTMNTEMMMRNIDPVAIKQQYRIQYPHLTDEQLNHATRAYIMQIQSAFTGRTNVYDKSHYQQEMARARSHQQQMYPGMYGASRSRTSGDVTPTDLDNQANTLKAYQQLVQAHRLQSQIAQRRQQMLLQRQMAMRQAQRANILRKKPAASGAPETITLDDEDEDDDDIQEVNGDDSNDKDFNPEAGGSDEIVLDGVAQVQEYQPQPSTSRKRRGRPRLDADTDPLI